MKRCGLLGKNIQYSRSPLIHSSYYQEKNLPLTYEIFDIEEENLSDFIKNLKQSNIIGFNVTIPYKEKILPYLDKLEYPADIFNAVNTVSVEGNMLIGYNTDYFGFIKSLEGYNLNGSNALVIGNGGSAKCIAFALKNLNCRNVSIYARNLEKAMRDLKGEYNILSMNNKINLMEYDIMVNCTPLGGANYADSTPLHLEQVKKGCIVYDLNYVPEKSMLLKSAESLGAIAINGESMLLNQAYLSADIWINNHFLVR